MPEVENHRRELKHLWRHEKDKKEGKWMGTAPVGYANILDAHKNKCISPVEPEASLIRWAFNDIARDVYSADRVRKGANGRS